MTGKLLYWTQRALKWIASSSQVELVIPVVCLLLQETDQGEAGVVRLSGERGPAAGTQPEVQLIGANRQGLLVM